MSVGTNETFWIVACSAAEQVREAIYSVLRSRVQKHNLIVHSAVLDVPLNLKFGSFDDLIRLADELVKNDATCEAVLRRLERQALDIDPAAELMVVFQRNTIPIDEYLHRFIWDEAKYPKQRYIRDNLEILLSAVARIDDETRIKGAAYNDVKQHHTSTTKKDATNFTQRDLIDILTPSVVRPDDFIETEHLTTVVVVVPRGQSDAWLKCYETLEHNVVPRSTRKFDVVDREESSLWKVVLFKSSLEAFASAARAKRFTVREFKYSPTAVQTKLEERSRLESEKSKQESFMVRVCLAAFSDVFIAWTHIKVIRVFVEAVLRYGVPPNFAAFLLKPTLGKEMKLRKELTDVFTTQGMFGKAYIEGTSSHGTGTAADTALMAELGDEEYYPYVSITMVPFAQFQQK